MRKRLVFVLIVMFIPMWIFSATNPGSYQVDLLDLTAYVPEDFGIKIPDGALMLDRFVFENAIETSHAAGAGKEYVYSLISTSELSLGTLEENENNFLFRMLYYGNKEKDYDIYISMDVGDGLKMERNGIAYYIPIAVSIAPSEERPDDVTCYSLGGNEAFAHIPAVGPRRGIPVFDVALEWDGNADIAAGSYSAELRIELRMS